MKDSKALQGHTNVNIVGQNILARYELNDT